MLASHQKCGVMVTGRVMGMRLLKLACITSTQRSYCWRSVVLPAFTVVMAFFGHCTQSRACPAHAACLLQRTAAAAVGVRCVAENGEVRFDDGALARLEGTLLDPAASQVRPSLPFFLCWAHGWALLMVGVLAGL